MTAPHAPETAGTPVLSVHERRAVAAALRRHKQAMAIRANDRFFAAHPDWHKRFGPAAVVRGLEDAAFHIEFLARAIEAGEVGAFADYVAWLIDVLAARGIGGEPVAESLTLIGAECLACTEGGVHAMIALVLQGGIARARSTNRDAAAGSGSLNAVACDPPERWPFDSASAPFLQAILQGQRHEAAGIARQALRDRASGGTEAAAVGEGEE